MNYFKANTSSMSRKNRELKRGNRRIEEEEERGDKEGREDEEEERGDKEGEEDEEEEEGDEEKVKETEMKKK